MKKLKYILFILPFLFGFNVFAKEVDVTSNCYGTTGYSNMYSGNEVQYQTYSNYTFGTTYQYQLSSLETELRYSLSANTDYTITFNTNNTNDFRNNFSTYNVFDLNNNNNNLVTGFTFVSMKKVQISFKTTSATNKVYVQMGGSNVYDNITGETNWNIKNVILTIPDSAPSGSTNQDVINNATNNTNTIVNNQNQNTSDIINNNNENSQNIIDNQNKLFGNCSTSPNILNSSLVTQNGYIDDADGVLKGSSSSKSTTYISISSSHKLYIIPGKSTGNWGAFYDTNYNYISGITGFSGSTPRLLNVPSNAKYIRFTISFNGNNNNYIENTLIANVDNAVTFSKYGEEVCTSKIDTTNDYLMDDTDPDISDNEFLSLFNSIGFNDPLSYLLQLPVQFINQLVSQSNSCQTVNLGTLYNVPISLPCINIGSIIGQQVWDIIDVLFSVGLLVLIIKNLYQTFANLMTMGGEKEAREKFSMPTPMEFLSMILGGDR